jgi:hypothetical protein
MAVAARWIRVETQAEPALRAAVAGFARACAGFARAQMPRSAPAVLWAHGCGGRASALALVAPLKFAPGRRQRWQAWGLSPLIAAFRHAGLRAYLEGGGIYVSGRQVAHCEAAAAGACAIVIASFKPPAGAFMDRLRERIESQHGWQFDHAWPSAAERAAIDEALAERVDAD